VCGRPLSGAPTQCVRQGDLAWLAGENHCGLFKAVEELELSLSFHMDIDQAPVVARLASRHCAVPVIIDYLGPGIHARRDAETYLDCLAAEPNIYFKLLCTAEDAGNAYPFPDIVVFYRKVLGRFGARRVMFGSDYPGAARICSYDKLIAWGENFPGLDERDRAQVMGETARRLFWRRKT
jgi:L-fuconolactonase